MFAKNISAWCEGMSDRFRSCFWGCDSEAVEPSHKPTEEMIIMVGIPHSGAYLDYVFEAVKNCASQVAV
jgi:hypothetical protein